MWNRQTLVDLIESKLQGYRLILVSNREPYIHLDGKYHFHTPPFGGVRLGSRSC
jgi:hypothetical protein